MSYVNIRIEVGFLVLLLHSADFGHVPGDVRDAVVNDNFLQWCAVALKDLVMQEADLDKACASLCKTSTLPIAEAFGDPTVVSGCV